MKVLIAIDDSKPSRALIEEAANRRWSEDTHFLVLHVIALPSSEFWQGLSMVKEMREKLLVEADALTKNAAAELRKPLGTAIKIETAVGQGHAVDCILQVARDWSADLIVLGSHGRRGVSRMLLGSVAEAVLLQAECSVEIIRAKKHTEETEETEEPLHKTTVLY